MREHVVGSRQVEAAAKCFGETGPDIVDDDDVSHGEFLNGYRML
jgi:hypothetical protein